MAETRTRLVGIFLARSASSGCHDVQIWATETDVSTSFSTSTVWRETGREYRLTNGTPVKLGVQGNLTNARTGEALQRVYQGCSKDADAPPLAKDVRGRRVFGADSVPILAGHLPAGGGK